ncbi:hypothetical protein ACIP2X_13445 [Streptomyces sp. NPDC089424]|uniref:hypothetical protein n=1 Tax=Streptomyces sp. NPDC089424 TaxID=3365917 RepID=UPI00381C35FB
MSTPTAANGDSRLSLWLRVREFAVPPSMIETATARRRAGDWAGACAAAGIDVDLNLRAVARAYGREPARLLRADLRHLAPDLLRWHMPRAAPDGLLRPGLTVALARYDTGDEGADPVHLVARTAPAWADAGQRISLAVWGGAGAGSGRGPGTDSGLRTDPGARVGAGHLPAADAGAGARPMPGGGDRTDAGARPGADARDRTDAGASSTPGGGDRTDTRAGGRDADAARGHLVDASARSHPHPHPSRRFRLDLHRHLWDARRTDELRTRSGADLPPGARSDDGERGWAVDRWADEAAILLRAEGRSTGPVAVRIGARRRLVLDCGPELPAPRTWTASTARDPSALPVLPDAATWVLPDLELLRAGLIEADRLHPLVASALLPDHSPAPQPVRAPGPAEQAHLVDCRGARHRIGLVDGVLTPLDHDPAEIRREELLAELTGTPLPCLRAVDTARQELEAAARQRIVYGMYRSGLHGAGPYGSGLYGSGPYGSGPYRSGPYGSGPYGSGPYEAGLYGSEPVPPPSHRRRPRDQRTHPRHATRP